MSNNPKKRNLEEEKCIRIGIKVAKTEQCSSDRTLQANQDAGQQGHQPGPSGCQDNVNEVKEPCSDSITGHRKSHLGVSDLPLTILLKAFAYLPLHDLLHGVSLVNNAWHTLAHDPSLWRRICLRKYKNVTDCVLLHASTLSENVQYLDISDLRAITSEGVAAAIRNCPQLRTLKMLRCIHLQNPVFHSISENCPWLQQLYMDGCYALTDEDLKAIAIGCPKLELLRVNQCNAVTTTGIRHIAENCPYLRQITMDQCLKISDEAISVIVDNCPNLQAISCMSCNLTDEGVSLIHKAKELRFLEVSNIKAVTNKCIMKVIKNCPKLESINVSLCNSINDDCIEFAAKNAKNLKKLYLVSCDLSDKALVSIGEHSKIMETVDVGWCNAITDYGVRKISHTCPTLRYLGLMRCDQVTIAVSEEMVLKYPDVTFSTKWLDCKRLLERAKREGVPINIPDLGAPPLPLK